jgi:hypothetical protein
LRGGFFIFSSIGEAVSNTKKRDLTAPLTFILSRKGREEKKDERKRMTLMTPLTFILSRRGREELEKFSSRASSPLTWED